MKVKESLEDDVKDEKTTNISQNIPDSALKKPAITGITFIIYTYIYYLPRLEGILSLAVLCNNSKNHAVCVVMCQMGELKHNASSTWNLHT